MVSSRRVASRSAAPCSHNAIRLVSIIRETANNACTGVPAAARAIDVRLQRTQTLGLSRRMRADETLDRTVAGPEIAFRILLGQPAPVIEVEIRHAPPSRSKKIDSVSPS